MARRHLLADLGGTNTRLALAEDGRLLPETLRRYRNDEFASFESVVAAFLAEPCFAAMVGDDRVRRLFEMRSRVKEMGEAYSVLQQLRALVAELTIAGTRGADTTMTCRVRRVSE